MFTAALRAQAASLMLITLLALAGCGSNSTKVCNAANCCTGDLCTQQQFLFAADITGQVSGYPVNPSTGALGTAVSTSGPMSSLGITSLNNQFLYASNPQLSQLTSTIDAWSIDTNTGALTPMGTPLTLPAPSVAAGMAINSNAQVVYVADGGRIDALKADYTGALTPLPNSPFFSRANLYLTVDPSNRFLFASADDPPGGVSAFTIDSTGALSLVAGSPFPAIPNSTGSVIPFGVVVDAAGSFVYTVIPTTNQVAGFSIVAPSGALNPVPGSPFAAGNGAFTIVTARNFLYVANAMDKTISGYAITAGSGVLTPLANSPFAVPASVMVTDPTGKYLYASGPGGIFVFTIDASTGDLSPIPGSPFPGVGATALTYVP